MLDGSCRWLRDAAARRDLAGPCVRARRAPAAARCGHRGGARQDAQHRRAGALPRRLLLCGGERGPRRRTHGGALRQPSGGDRPNLRLRARVREARAPRGAVGIRTLDAGAAGRGSTSRHPVHPPQRAVTGAAGPRDIPEADPGHDDQPDQLVGRRHRLGQEAHQSPAAGDRHPRPALRGGAQRG